MLCKDVATGSGRVFRCLAEHLEDGDFGDACKSQIANKLQRRQSNWKLDPSLRKACKADVAQLCADEESKNSEDGLVFKCLVKSHDSLSESCAREVSRALHMALYVWQEGGTLTAPCDEDIKKHCGKLGSGGAAACLANIVSQDLTNYS